MTHVIVPDLPTRVQYSIGATPAVGPFAFSFTFFEIADIHVYVGDVLQTAVTHYNLAGNPGSEGGFQGGSVTFVAPVANTTVTILRGLPIERVSDFPVAGSFNRQTLNNTLDRHVAMMQQIDERVDRAIVLPPTSSGPVLVANAFPQVNPTATGWELLTPAQLRTEIAAQPLDATLTGLAALIVGADQLPYGTGLDTFGLTTITPFGRSVLDDTSSADLVATMGLGTMAQQNANAVNITGGAIAGAAITGGSVNTPALTSSNAQITGGRITGMPQPTVASEVVTKGYADALAIGVSKRSTVRVTNNADIIIGFIQAGTIVQDVTLVIGDRVLLKNQTNATENGVYVVGPTGPPARAVDFDTYDEHPGSLITVQEGTDGHDTVWLCVSNIGGTLGVTPIVFEKVQVSPLLPLVIGEGGTGQTTALAAFDALKQSATTVYAGVAREATQVEIDAAAAVSAFVRPDRLLASPLARGSYRNILGRNGGFEVWQRGAGGSASFPFAASASGYVSDGWFYLNGNSALAVSQWATPLTNASRYGILLHRTAGQTGVNVCRLEFPLDTDEIVPARGSVVTLSLTMMAGPNFSPAGSFVEVQLWTGTSAPAKRSMGPAYSGEVQPINTAQAITTTATRYTFTSTVPVGTNVTCASLMINFTPTGTAGPADWFMIDDVQLEIGSVATPFERRPFEQELAACQRHFQKSFIYANVPQLGAGSGVHYWSTRKTGAVVNYGPSFRYPVEMRVPPTCTLYNPSVANNQVRNVSLSVDMTGSTVTSTFKDMRVDCTGTAGTTIGDLLGVNYIADAGI